MSEELKQAASNFTYQISTQHPQSCEAQFLLQLTPDALAILHALLARFADECVRDSRKAT